MPSRPLETEAFVLLKRAPTDKFQGLTVFSPAHGVLALQQRLPSTARRRAATASGGPAHVTLDLFDEVALQLESSNQGHTWFVKEARLLTRHDSIGRNYDRLRFASALAKLIARNPVSEESRPQIAALLRNALAAFARTDRPDLAYFKCLYRFARDEGYPVREQWLPSLPSKLRTAAASLLRSPTDSVPAEDDSDALTGQLLHALEAYLGHHTEIILK